MTPTTRRPRWAGFPIAAFVAVLMSVAVGLGAPDARAQVGDGSPEAGPVETEPGGLTLKSRTPDPNLTSPDQVELYVPHDDQVVGRVSIPDQKLATLVQPEGRTWRAFRMEGLFWTAIGVIGVTVLGLAAFFLYRGRIRISAGRSGTWIPRFSFWERLAHWTAALSFISLAITGLIVTFGRYALIPLIGHDAFTATSEVAKYVHNFSGTPFVFAILFMLVVWIKDNIPSRADWDWLRHAGGVLKGASYHPETERFNAGQKGIFWAVVLGGLAMSVTGYLMLAPFAVTGVGGMQIFHVVHGLLAVLLTAIIIAHIYIGTLGMEGAFDAMGRGEVDENWAKEHHRGWYETKRPPRVYQPPRTPPGEVSPAE
ncbi:formate dehydrogenase subunit gamma [Chthonobacter rhizosphaerae]|uniref:formate dehydrogenase subunit gamma n=1 Tax=Chthonobacter rhizosphaerae TaxID=2735553 RepID=UPI001AED8AE9|nr:formate dehydrogenase subunit gamma [Chthonobacter rhizosphaerae]